MNPFQTHGAVSWCEHLSPDPEAALKFYGQLLGWTHYSMEMEMGGTYYVALQGKTNVAGFMERPHEDIPPCWSYYVTVNDIKGLVETHKPELFVPITDTPMGPFCGLMDEQGGMIHAIQYAAPEKESEGVTDFVSAFTSHGVFSWFELRTTDSAAAAEHYGKLFGWNVKPMEDAVAPYQVISVGEVGIGGISEYVPEGAPPYWHGYITVDDVDRRAASAESLGGRLLGEPFDLPGVGRMIHILDPDGATVTLVKYVDFT